MAKYAYPAIFKPEDGMFSVDFPDIPGCYTSGDSLADAISMAEDALALMMYHYEQEGREVPAPSEIDALQTDAGSFASFVACDTLGYRKRNNTRAVKKTLSIPEWLNEEAISAGLNFSQVLQEALQARLQS